MRRYFLLSLPILFVLGLTACGNVGGLNLAQYPDPNASTEEFIYCHGYGCTSKSYAWFTPKQWKAIERVFKKPAATPEQERSQIAKAIALMEKQTAFLVGTQEDQAKAPINRVSHMELDCIDETVNTTKYLRFLEEAEWLKFHMVGKPAYRGYMINGMYPHNTATIIEIETQDVYVVDTYVYANGEKPDIREIDSWLTTRIEDL